MRRDDLVQLKTRVNDPTARFLIYRVPVNVENFTVIAGLICWLFENCSRSTNSATLQLIVARLLRILRNFFSFLFDCT